MPSKTAKERNPNPVKGRKYPADPISVSDIVKLIDACRPYQAGPTAVLLALRLRALIVLLWRTGMRISEAIALHESDLNFEDRTILIRRGKGGKRRVVGMDLWAWSEIEVWIEARKHLPAGPLLCAVVGTSKGNSWSTTDSRSALRQAGDKAGLRRRVNPHCFRHAFAVELWRAGVDFYTIMAQLGHARLDVTAAYLRGVGQVEVVQAVVHRQPPVMPVPNPLKSVMLN